MNTLPDDKKQKWYDFLSGKGEVAAEIACYITDSMEEYAKAYAPNEEIERLKAERDKFEGGDELKSKRLAKFEEIYDKWNDGTLPDNNIWIDLIKEIAWTVWKAPNKKSFTEYWDSDKDELISYFKKWRQLASKYWLEAYAPVPSEEIERKINDLYIPVKRSDYSNIKDYEIAVSARQELRYAAHFGYSLAAPVPGKEEMLKRMLDWHDRMLKEKRFNIPLDHEQSEYLSWLAFELSQNPFPSTASNEDKYIEGLKKLLQIADCPQILIDYPEQLFSKPTEADIAWAKRSVIEYEKAQSNEDKWVHQFTNEQQFLQFLKWRREQDNEPKAVQQAAKEYGEWQLCPKCGGNGSLTTGELTLDGKISFACSVCEGDKIIPRPVLDGASFNSDAVEFLNWVFENGYVYNTEDGYLWLNDVPYLVDETYSVFKQNNIQQAHDKAQYE